jgi:hypothetical protein
MAYDEATYLRKGDAVIRAEDDESKEQSRGIKRGVAADCVYGRRERISGHAGLHIHSSVHDLVRCRALRRLRTTVQTRTVRPALRTVPLVTA